MDFPSSIASRLASAHASSTVETAVTLRAAAQAYKVNTDAIDPKVKQEFAAKEKARGEKKAQTAVKPARNQVA
jgi:ParB family chromosome partitioning protein